MRERYNLAFVSYTGPGSGNLLTIKIELKRFLDSCSGGIPFRLTLVNPLLLHTQIRQSESARCYRSRVADDSGYRDVIRDDIGTVVCPLYARLRLYSFYERNLSIDS